MGQILPVLDLRHFCGAESQRRNFLNDLRSAARDFGFFYLAGHGLRQPDLDEILALSRRFFALPMAEKLAIDMIHSPHFRGYTATAAEFTRGLPDWREQIDFSAECEPVLPIENQPAWASLLGPNQWPAGLPEMRNTVLAWQAAMADVSLRLLEAFACSLEQPEDVFAHSFRSGPNFRTKFAHYPGRDVTGGEQGVGPHKDSGFFTLLLQDASRGLQFENEGKWVDAPPVPEALVVNVGELLELASNGYFRANLHRALVPPIETDRYSIAFFFNASLDAAVPLLNLPPHLAGAARGLEREAGNPVFREVGLNVLKTRLRSHPDVARRFYPDMLGLTRELLNA